MLKTYCFGLYPTRSQARLLDHNREAARKFYNQCLEERKTAYEERGESLPKFAQLRRVKDFKAHNEHFGNVHSHILQVACADLDKAYQAFFRRVKNKEKAGFPRFKGFHRFDSFGFKEYGNGFSIDGRRLKLSRIGRVPVRWHRALPSQPKTVRIIKKADGWYACLVCEATSEVWEPTGKEAGVDVGIQSLLTLSDGAQVENPKWYRGEQKKLRILQRTVARRKKGSAGRRKSVVQLKKQHLKIQRRREDCLDKVAHGLLQRYDRLALENLNIRGMARNRHLSKSILDAGWGYLVKRLICKAEEAGKCVVLVNPAYTSKKCWECGREFGDFSLSVRWVSCECGVSLDRDENAAKNILRLGQSLWAPTWGQGGSRCKTTAVNPCVVQEAVPL